MAVFILDEIVVKPGFASRYRDAYRASYMPGAKRRGMTLEDAWQHPPELELADRPTTLYYLWSVPDVAGWWKMRLSRTPEGADERFEKLAWWQESDRMILDRKRRFLSRQPEGG